MTSTSGAFHWELCEELERAVLPGNRLVGVCPRGMAKTTWGTIILPLWAAATGRKKFIRIWCKTLDAAGDKLGDVFAYIHDDNHPLRQDYGSDLLPEIGHRGRELKFTGNEVLLGNGVKIKALDFINKSARGMKHRETRPDLDILDDPEDEANVENDKWRRDMKSRYNRVLLAGLNLNNHSLIHLGTIVHDDSILNWLLEPDNGKKDWRRWETYKDIWAIEPGADPAHPDGLSIWPEHYTADKLKVLMEELGTAAFNAEMRNMPINPDDQRFRDEMFKKYSPQQDGLQQVNGAWHVRLPAEFVPPGAERRLQYLQTIMGVDLAITDKDDSDFSAYCVLGLMWVPQLDKPLRFILEVKRVKVLPHQQIDILRELALHWGVRIIACEKNAAEKIILGEMKQRGWDVRDFASAGHDAKRRRITESSIGVQNGLVYLPQPDTDYVRAWYKTFLAEAETFPKGAKRDQLDAFAWADKVADSMSGNRGGVITGKRRESVRDTTRDMR